MSEQEMTVVDEKTGEIIESVPKIDSAKLVKEIKSYMSKKPARMFGENRHAEIDDLIFAASRLGLTVKTGETTYQEHGDLKGFKATATVINRHGQVVGSADGICMNDEKFWKASNLHNLAGMAQTRAASRALSNHLRPLLKLAGFATAPAEEMTNEERPAIKVPKVLHNTVSTVGSTTRDAEIPFGEAPQAEKVQKTFQGQINEKQRALLFARWKEAGFDDSALRKHLLAKYNTEHTSGLNNEQLNEILKMLDGLKEENA